MGTLLFFERDTAEVPHRDFLQHNAKMLSFSFFGKIKIFFEYIIVIGKIELVTRIRGRILKITSAKMRLAGWLCSTKKNQAFDFFTK